MLRARALVAVSLLLLALMHTLALTAIRLRFEMRRTEIARTLCENRFRPELGCQGACVLRQELKTAAERTAGLLRLGANTLADLFLPASPLVLDLTLAPPYGAASRQWPGVGDDRAVTGFAAGQFRPPAGS